MFGGGGVRVGAGELYDAGRVNAKQEFGIRFGFQNAITRNTNLVKVLTAPDAAVNEINTEYQRIINVQSQGYMQIYNTCTRELFIPADVAQGIADEMIMPQLKFEMMKLKRKYPFVMSGDAGSNPFANILSGKAGKKMGKARGVVEGIAGGGKRKFKEL